MDNKNFKVLKSGFPSILRSEFASTSSINDEFTENNLNHKSLYL